MNNTNSSDPTCFQDYVSQSSSPDHNSLNLGPNEEGSPGFCAQNSHDPNVISSQSKKIRKKRSAYDKIDDEKRLELLTSVQQRGETLKSAAKRLGVNYSSAKSIFHTYRKEGRILKKSALDKPIQVCSFPINERDGSPVNSNMLGFPEKFHVKKSFQQQEGLRPIDLSNESATTTTSFSDNSPSSPMKGLTDTFGHLILGLQQNREELKPHIPNFLAKLSAKQLAGDSPFHQQIGLSCNLSALNSAVNQTPSNPLELLKHLDDFVMNYSSPLSGGRGNIFGDCSDSGSRRYYPKEFDSFSDMITALQVQNRVSEETKAGIQIPRPLRFNSSQLLQDKIDTKNVKDDSMDFSDTIESAAIDTFRSFMDAQWLIRDAYKKATYLNNLVQFQRTGISPINGGNK